MTRQTNRRLIWIGFVAIIAIFPTSLLGKSILNSLDKQKDMKNYIVISTSILVSFEALLGFFCFFFYGWFARFSSWIIAPIEKQVAAGQRKDLVARNIGLCGPFYRAIGIWVEEA
jgi:hypothetical protein